MLRYHMAVITRDNALKRHIKRVTTATGATADYIGDASGINPKTAIDLAIFDARAENPDKQFFAKLPDRARILYIIPGDTLIDKITLLKDRRVTSLFCHDERFDDDEFISTATKALRGEVFGLQKYFPWGVTTFSMIVKNYDQKGKAIDVLMRYAHLAGIRGPVRDRIQLVADELMMNALYHAPVDDKGNELFAGKTLKELSQLPEVNPIQVQYGCSGRYFGLSVRDGGGSLTRERALEYLIRAKTGSKIEDKTTGAGLGLISVLRSVSKLVFNLDQNHSTEVIGLFDIELFAKGRVGARSLHLFYQAPHEDEADEEEEQTAPVPSLRPSNTGKWAFAAVLLVVLSVMATTYYFREVKPAVAKQAAPVATPITITVLPDPADAVITLAGQRLRSGVPAEWPSDSDRAQLRVERDGYQPWTQELARSEAKGDLRFHVALSELPRRNR